MTRSQKYHASVIVAAVLGATIVGCTSMLPMDSTVTSTLPESEIQRIMERTGVSLEQVLDPTIHRVDEQEMGCWELIKTCWSGLPWYLKALGSVPLACTTIYQWPDGTKSATINHCWWTTDGVMEHEREHTKGHGHAYW